jgi:hypothetical protein
MSDKALKYDAEKTRHELLSDLAIDELARVLTFGAKKYAADNWRKGMEWRRLIGAARRHISEFSKGIDLDPETGLSHLAHAMCCLMFAEEYRQTGTGTDDRYRAPTRQPAHVPAIPPSPAWVIRELLQAAEKANTALPLDVVVPARSLLKVLESPAHVDGHNTAWDYPDAVWY